MKNNQRKETMIIGSIKIKILSVFMNIIACLLGAFIQIYFQNWFGISDINALVFCTIPLAVGLSVIGNTILTLYRTRNWILRLLLSGISGGIIAFGYVFLVYFILLGPFIYSFSINIFYLWITSCIIQLIFMDLKLSNKFPEIRIHKIALILAFPIIFVATIITLLSVDFFIDYSNRRKVTFLIPHTFSGRVTIVYGEECGIKPDYEDNRLLLEIPENGILIIKPKFKDGILDYCYYFVDEKGNREKLEYIDDLNKNPRGVGGGGAGGSYSSESNIKIEYEYFDVYNGSPIKDNFESESILKQVEICRGKCKMTITQ